MDLKNDVLEALDEAVELLSLTAEDAIQYGYSLNAEQPELRIRVPGGWRIVTLLTLNPEEQAEALAHELGHLLLQGEGLALVSVGDTEPECILAEEINSVIAHRFIVRRLMQDYQLSSELPMRLRAGVLHVGWKLIEELADEKTMLHALGLRLLDLMETTKGSEEQIEGLLKMSPEVRASYEAGQKFLLYPAADLPPEEQYRRVKAYLEELRYATGLLRLCG